MSYRELIALTRRTRRIRGRTAVFVPSHVRWCRCRWCKSHPVERWQGLKSSAAPSASPAWLPPPYHSYKHPYVPQASILMLISAVCLPFRSDPVNKWFRQGATQTLLFTVAKNGPTSCFIQFKNPKSCDDRKTRYLDITF